MVLLPRHLNCHGAVTISVSPTSKKASLKHGEWLPWLVNNADVLGFSTPQTAGKLMRAAKLNVDVQFEDEATAVTMSRKLWGNEVIRGTQGTGENEWYTPA